MLEGDEYSRILDILGNRNRRRIISLLQQKPCFVTELSERLTLSPKALIEHLALMEQMEILGSYLDDRRRKYYYLTRDISVRVSFEEQGREVRSAVREIPPWQSTLIMLRRMMRAREELTTNLEHLDQDIEQKIGDLARQGGDLISSDEEMDIILALSHYDLTLSEIHEFMDTGSEMVELLIDGLMDKGIVEKKGNRYRLRGIDSPG
ncbi:MAG: ArsR family transcriptional regulator [Methanomicrobiales archaeon]|nr:ArsR family transcriptional regulator [Methanomicrobiales archaeon]MDD1668261.1 ArsR family transcriptional regulator [Methanomicrobiales archaeon]